MSSGIIRRFGLEIDEETKKEVLRAIVDYPNGPPDGMKVAWIWNSLPVKIVLDRDDGESGVEGKVR